jgi:hypothetical protein
MDERATRGEPKTLEKITVKIAYPVARLPRTLEGLTS